MSRKSWGLKSPEKFMFQTSILVGERFREYCDVNRYVIGRVLEDLIIDHLIEEGIISNREELAIEQLRQEEIPRRADSYVPNPILEAKIKQREETAAKIEAAIKEAKEHNTRIEIERHSK